MGIFLLPAYLTVAWVQFDISSAIHVFLFDDPKTAVGRVVGYEEKLGVAPESGIRARGASTDWERVQNRFPVVQFTSSDGSEVRFTSHRAHAGGRYSLNAPVPVIYPAAFPGHAVIYSFTWPGGTSAATGMFILAAFAMIFLLITKREGGGQVLLVKDYSPSPEFKQALLLMLFLIAAVIVGLVVMPYVEPMLASVM